MSATTTYTSSRESGLREGSNAITLILELTPEQDQQIQAEARQQGMDAASYAKTLLFDAGVFDDSEEGALPPLGLCRPRTAPGWTWRRNIQCLNASLIAANAIGLGATLCTFNVKHYHNTAGLMIEPPYAH